MSPDNDVPKSTFFTVMNGNLSEIELALQNMEDKIDRVLGSRAEAQAQSSTLDRPTAPLCVEVTDRVNSIRVRVQKAVNRLGELA